jgi:2-oxoisovalerate dehydrogenase E2 component (dihydrolipoyl transacylase)
MTDKATVEMTSPVTARCCRRCTANSARWRRSARRWSNSRSRARAQGARKAHGAAPLRRAEADRRPPKRSRRRRRPQGAPPAPRPPAAEAGLPPRALPAKSRWLARGAPARAGAASRCASSGHGPGRPHQHDDLDAFIASGGGSQRRRHRPYAKREGVEEIKVIGLRRKIAEKMQDAKRRIPHFAYVEEIDVTALEELRAHLNATKGAGQPKLTCCPS